MTTPTIVTLTVVATCAAFWLAQTRYARAAWDVISLFTWVPWACVYSHLRGSLGSSLAAGFALWGSVLVILLQLALALGLGLGTVLYHLIS